MLDFGIFIESLKSSPAGTAFTMMIGGLVMLASIVLFPLSVDTENYHQLEQAKAAGKFELLQNADLGIKLKIAQITQQAEAHKIEATTAEENIVETQEQLEGSIRGLVTTQAVMGNEVTNINKNVGRLQKDIDRILKILEK
jgi:hypothetical protein